jgi:hypothetical protein
MSFPKTGKNFPTTTGGKERSTTGYAALISRALSDSLGETHRAVKTLMRWTSANERTVKNWLTGRHGPAGDHLLVLLRESKAVMLAVLTAAGRSDVLDVLRLVDSYVTISDVLSMARRQREIQAETPTTDRSSSLQGHSLRLADVPKDVPEDGPLNVPLTAPATVPLSERQRWFLAQLVENSSAGATDLASRWGVSVRTAKRDIASLIARGLVRHVGSRRRGQYVGA